MITAVVRDLFDNKVSLEPKPKDDTIGPHLVLTTDGEYHRVVCCLPLYAAKSLFKIGLKMCDEMEELEESKKWPSDYICKKCALKFKGMWPEGHAATFHEGVCEYCYEKASLAKLAIMIGPTARQKE